MGTHRRATLTSGRVFGAQQGLWWIAIAIVLSVGQRSSMMAQEPSVTPDRSALPEITSALRAQHFSEALKRSRDALMHMPRDPRLWTLEALSYQGLHQPVEAIFAFRKALAIEPKYLPALQGAAQLSYANDNPQTEVLLTRLLGLRLHLATMSSTALPASIYSMRWMPILMIQPRSKCARFSPTTARAGQSGRPRTRLARKSCTRRAK